MSDIARLIQKIRLPDYTKRLYNIPSSDPATQGAA